MRVLIATAGKDCWPGGVPYTTGDLQGYVQGGEWRRYVPEGARAVYDDETESIYLEFDASEMIFGKGDRSIQYDPAAPQAVLKRKETL